MPVKEVWTSLDGVKKSVLINWLENPLTTAERTTLGASLNFDNTGLGVYDTTLNEKFYWTGIGWTSSGGSGLSDGDYGDITVSGGGTVMTIDSNVITFAKMQTISTDVLLGRDTVGVGNVEQITLGTGLGFSAGSLINTSPDQVVSLTPGTGVGISGAYPNFTIGHSDTSSVANLDTSAAQVIDTLTFDTFGHVQAVTTRNLTLADLGYVVPTTGQRFGVAGEDNTSGQDRDFGANQFDWYVQNSSDIFLQAAGVDSGFAWYSHINLWSGYLDLQQDYGTGQTEIALQPRNGIGEIVLTARVGGSLRSDIIIRSDYLRIIPEAGDLRIDDLTNLAGQNRLLGQASGTNNQIGFITLGTGLSLSLGVLTNSSPDQVVALSNGAGISVTGTYPNFTIASTDLGSSQFIFKNIAVSGQSTVVADSNNDTLTLIAGTNITITTDATTDSITINSTSGGSGTVNTGAANLAAYYPSAGTTVDDWAGVKFNQTNINTEIIGQATGDILLKITKIAGQTGDILRANHSNGNICFQVNKNGNIVSSGIDISGVTLQNPESFDNMWMLFGSGNARFGVYTGSGYDHKAAIVVGDFSGSYGGVHGGYYGMETNHGLNFITNNTTKAVVTTDGRLYGTSLHNNAGAVTGATNHYIASGTYTPTLFNTTNISASTAYTCQWIRVGNVVTVSGKVDIDDTIAATATELGMSLPIASAFTVEEDLGGSASSAAAASLSSAIRADATNDRASFVFVSVSLTNDSYFFTFTYLVK